MAKSFGSWLKAQQHRDDPIGDLAQDFITACKWRKENPERLGDDDVRFQMDCLSASVEAIRAFRQAKREWSASR